MKSAIMSQSGANYSAATRFVIFVCIYGILSIFFSIRKVNETKIKMEAIYRENTPSAATGEKERNDSAVTGKESTSSLLAAESSLPAELPFSMARAQVMDENYRLIKVSAIASVPACTLFCCEFCLQGDSLMNLMITLSHIFFFVFNMQNVSLSGSNETDSKGLDGGVAKKNESSTGFPITQFSPHVNHLVEAIDVDQASTCGIRFHFTVSSPYSVPSIDCVANSRFDRIRKEWCKVLHVTFANKERVLPRNVTFDVSHGDWTDPKRHGYGCFGNSGPGGKFTITNILEIRRMSQNRKFATLPWEERHNIPVWRGSSWTKGHVKVANESTVLEQLIRNGRKTRRVEAVLFSREHPGLIDAKLSSTRGILGELWERNATNGVHKLLPFHTIPEKKYYSQYRVAVVFGGIGAAFRTSIHLSTGTAVVLHTFRFEEWFTRFMKPFVHYIPLAEDLSDLNQTMHWIRDNPEEVRNIANRGQEFYEQHLSFERNQEFYYELLYKLALKSHNAPY
jgi:hypothetical protein